MSESPSVIHFDGKLKAMNDKVVIRKEEKRHERTFGDIFVPTESFAGYGASTAVVEDVSEIGEEFGLSIGDRIYFDEYAVHAPTFPIAVVNIDSVIAVIDEDEDKDITPLGSDILIEFEKAEQEDVGGIVLPSGADPSAIQYAIIKNFGKCWDKCELFGELEIGDRIMVENRGFTELNISNRKCFIIHSHTVIAKVEEV